MRFLAPLSLLLMLCCTFARASEPQLSVPPELQPDVQFWIRVYSEISTNEGFIHDQHNLAVVYETVHFGPELSPKERQARVDEVRAHYQLILEHLASGAEPQDPEEQRVMQLWGPEASLARFEQARVDVRFQLGQAIASAPVSSAPGPGKPRSRDPGEPWPARRAGRIAPRGILL